MPEETRKKKLKWISVCL